MDSEKASISAIQIAIRDQIFSKQQQPLEHFNSPFITQHWCRDCGDKFIFKSSYIQHMLRQSIKITYYCKVCDRKIQYSNRCSLLSHIRSHIHISQTIVLSDIQIEPIDHSAVTFESSYNDDEETISMETFKKLKESQVIDLSDIDMPPCNPPPDNCNTEENLNSKINSIIKDIHKDFEVAFEELEQESPPMDFSFYSINSNENTNLENHIEIVPETTLLSNESLVSNELNSSIEVVEPDIVSGTTVENNNRAFKSNNFCVFCQYEYGDTFSRRKRNRRKHYQESRDIISCQHCKLHFVNMCAYKAHQSIHSLQPPFVCSECGLIFHMSHLYYKHIITNCFYLAKTVISHCSENRCDVFPYENLFAHFMEEHVEVYAKCSVCAAVFPSQNLLTNHSIEKHQINTEPILFHVCNPCSESFNSKSEIMDHIETVHRKNIKKHNNCYRCYGCKSLHFPLSALKSHIENCSLYLNSEYNKSVQKLIPMNNKTADLIILKRQCCNCKLFSFNIKNSITSNGGLFPCLHCLFITDTPALNNSYNKKYLQKITSVLKPKKRLNENFFNSLRAKKRRRTMKNKEISEDSSTRTGILLSPSKSANNEELSCAKCNFTSKEKNTFVEHVKTHRDVSSNYQCMDCGLGFVTKQSLCSHLIIIHAISDTENYIIDNSCHNNCLDGNGENSTKLKENQCEVCLDIFKSPADLDKHFRIHGMAFILAKQKQKLNSQT